MAAFFLLSLLIVVGAIGVIGVNLNDQTGKPAHKTK